MQDRGATWVFNKGRGGGGVIFLYKTSNLESFQFNIMTLRPRVYIFIDFIFWPPEVINIRNASRIIWGQKGVSEWNRIVWKWYFSVFSEFMEVKIAVNELRSQLLFLINLDNHNYRLHANFQPSISIVRTKRSLYKIWYHKVSNCSPPLEKGY